MDSGFEHPSEVQHECIPQAILGMDVICQAKFGMGKTAVFVLSTLQQIDLIPGQVGALVLCHTRELAYQVCLYEIDQLNLDEKSCNWFSCAMSLCIINVCHIRRIHYDFNAHLYICFYIFLHLSIYTQ